MDIPLKKRPWFVRYRYWLLAALAFLALLGYTAFLALGPRKFRMNRENVQMAEVQRTDFLEYVDVEGIVHPIMTVQVNSLEGGSVARIVGEEGDMVQPGDTLLVLENPQVERNIADKLPPLRGVKPFVCVIVIHPIVCYLLFRPIVCAKQLCKPACGIVPNALDTAQKA